MIPELIAALNAADTSFVTIDHAWALEPVDDLSSTAPAIFLYQGDSKGADEEGDSCVATVEQRSVVVFIACKWAELETLRNESKAVIRGYQLNSYQTPLKLAHGRTEAIKGEYIWWRDTYTTTDYS